MANTFNFINMLILFRNRYIITHKTLLSLKDNLQLFVFQLKDHFEEVVVKRNTICLEKTCKIY